MNFIIVFVYIAIALLINKWLVKSVGSMWVNNIFLYIGLSYIIPYFTQTSFKLYFCLYQRIGRSQCVTQVTPEQTCNCVSPPPPHPEFRPPGIVWIRLPSIPSHTLLPEPCFEPRRVVCFTEILNREYFYVMCEAQRSREKREKTYRWKA